MKKQKEHNKEKISLLERITQTVLYEGYSLYPYHRSSEKNMKPVPFGAVYPADYQRHHQEVHSTTQTQCIIEGDDKTEVAINVKFLHLKDRNILKIDPGGMGAGQFQPADHLQAGGDTFNAGWAAEEREIDLGTHRLSKLEEEKIAKEINLKGEQANDLIYANDGNIAGNILISQEKICGNVTVSAKRISTGDNNGFQITIQINNTTPIENAKKSDRNDMYGRAFLSTNTVLKINTGRFISPADPTKEWKEVAGQCENINTWPILVDKDDKTVLSSPIVLYDYPEIAPESKGDMFDSTEIEEALVLHMSTLTEEEKQKIDQRDDKMQAMLKRVENVTPEELLKLHGGLKEIDNNSNNSED